MFAVGNKQPLVDPSQDYELIGVSADHTGLCIRFRRKWNTCDDDNDYKIGVR